MAPTLDPRLIQSRSVVDGGVCDFRVNVTAGDVIIVNSSWSGGSFSSISDSLGTTYSAVTGFPFTGGGLTMGIWVGIAGSSGPNTVTVSVPGFVYQNIQCVEVRNITATVDVAARQAFSSTPASVSSGNVTTNFNREFLFGAAAGFQSNGVFKPTSSFIGVGWGNGARSAASSFLISGAPGTYAATFSNATNDTGITAIVALKSAAAVTITSPSALPDGVLSQAYDYTLTAVGGSSPYNWTITSGALQNGLALNATTGRISGTPTKSSLNTLVVTPDGGSTTKTVTLKIGGTPNTIAHVQDSSILENGIFPSDVTSGNLIVVGLRINPGSSVGVPKCTDLLGTDYFFVGNVLMGNGVFGEARYALIYAGIAPTTGANTVTAAAAGQLTASEFTNCQLFLDNIGTTAGSNGSTYTSNSLATLTPNELLVSMVTAFTDTAALTTNSPFTNVPRTHTAGSQDWNLASTVTGYTSSYGASGNVDGQWGIVLAGFRPTAGPVIARIIVQKTTTPPGSSQSFTFRPDWGSPFSLTDGQSNTSDLAAGTYSITEDTVAPWGTVISVSNGNSPTAITIAPGDIVTVTFTNSIVVPTPPSTDCVPTPLAPPGPQTWVYDFGTKGWFQLARGFTSLAVFEIGDGQQILVGGAEDGFVYVIDDLNGSFDLSGVCPAASFRPALIDFGDPTSMRVFKYLELEFTCDDLAKDITVTFWLDPSNVDNPGTGRKLNLTKVRGANRYRGWPQGGALCHRLLLDITVKASTNVGAIRGAKVVADKVKGLTT